MIKENNEEFDEQLAITNFIEKLNLSESEPVQQLIVVTKAVAEIPWGEGRTIQDVVEKGVGTCTGKHKFLQACYDQLGIKYEPVVVTFKWNQQCINFPDDLQAILDEGEWDHGHNFVHLNSGIDVDITWNPALAEYGFKTLPEDWDGKTSFVGVENIVKRWDNAKIDEMKAQLIGSLDEETRERRERFLHGFIKWINSINEG